MTLGKAISGPAALVVLICFFIPWVSVSCSGQTIGEFSGYDLALQDPGANIDLALNGAPVPNDVDGSVFDRDPLLLAVPAAAVLSVALLFAGIRGWTSEETASQAQVLAALIGLGILFWKWNQVRTEINLDQSGLLSYQVELGLLGSLAGLILIIAGAVATLVQSRAGGSPYVTSEFGGSSTQVGQQSYVPEQTSVSGEAAGFAGHEATPGLSDTLWQPAEQLPGPPGFDLPHPMPRHTEVLRSEPKELAWLIVREGPRAGHQFRLSENTGIGRDPVNEVVLDDTALSGQHARIKIEEGKFYLWDLASTNGTFVHDPDTGEWMKIYRQELADGTQIKVGRTVLHFMTLGTGPSEA